RIEDYCSNSQGLMLLVLDERGVHDEYRIIVSRVGYHKAHDGTKEHEAVRVSDFNLRAGKHVSGTAHLGKSFGLIDSQVGAVWVISVFPGRCPRNTRGGSLIERSFQTQ